MNPAAEQSFQELMGRFSESDLEELPLAYSVYREDLPTLVELLHEQNLTMPLERLDILKVLLSEAKKNQSDRLEASFEGDDEKLAELELYNQAIGEMALKEYFFSLTYLELGHFLQRMHFELRGSEVPDNILELQASVRESLVSAFRLIDELQ